MLRTKPGQALMLDGGVAGIALPTGTDGSALAVSESDEDVDVVGGVAGGAPAAGVDGVVEVVMAVVDAPPAGPGETQEEEVPGPPSARLATQAQRRKRPQRLGVVEDVGPPPPRRRTRVAAGVDGAAPRRRRHDGQLRLTTYARGRLELWIGGAAGGWPGPRKGEG